MERLSPAFTKKLERILSGTEQNISSVVVGLPNGDKAGAAMKVLLPMTDDRLVVLAVARHKGSGLVMGERHVHPLGTFDGLRWHTHNSAYCRGFEYVDDTFTALGFEAGEKASTRLTGPSGRAARLGVRIVRSLLHSPAIFDALVPDDTSEAFCLARTLMRGEGDPKGEGNQNRLLADPILQLALNQRIAESSGR